MKSYRLLPLLLVSILSVVATAVIFLVSTRAYALTIIRSVFGRTVPTCGCETVFSYSQHPFLFSALFLLSFAVVLLGAFALFHIVNRLIRTRQYVATLREHTVSVERTHIGAQYIVVRVVESNEAFAFCAGILQPTLYVSTATNQALTSETLEAVYHHEAAHIRYGHIVQRLLIEAAVACVPLRAATRERLLLGIESVLEAHADTVALQYVSQSSLLAACVTLIDLQATQPHTMTPRSLAVALTAFSHMNLRIQYLLGKQTTTLLSRRDIALLLSAAFVTIALMLFGISIPAQAAEKNGSSLEHVGLCMQEQERLRTEARLMDISIQSMNTVIENRGGQCIIPTMSIDPHFKINYPK